MDYKTTAEGESVVYLGVKAYVVSLGTKKEVHLTVYDREEAYPYHIIRYPELGTVAPPQQLGGVIMGRLVHCQETCSHMKDFKESVGTVFRHALWRGYPRRLVQSVWSRFLFLRWHSTDIRVKELRVWFSKVWAYLAKTEGQSRPDPNHPARPLSSSRESRFLNVVGVRAAQAASSPSLSGSSPQGAVQSSSAAVAPAPAEPPVSGMEVDSDLPEKDVISVDESAVDAQPLQPSRSLVPVQDPMIVARQPDLQAAAVERMDMDPERVVAI